MLSVLVVDNQPRKVARLWKLSDCVSSGFELLQPIESFNSIRRTCNLVKEHKPNVVLVSYMLGRGYHITGADVVCALRDEGYDGYVVANSTNGDELFRQAGVEVNGCTNRRPKGMRGALCNLLTGRMTERTIPVVERAV